METIDDERFYDEMEGDILITYTYFVVPGYFDFFMYWDEHVCLISNMNMDT